MKRDREVEIADWIVETCLFYGTTTATAFQIAAWFIQALADDRKEQGK